MRENRWWYSDAAIGLVLAFIAMSWRLYARLDAGPPTGDELIGALTAFEILRNSWFVPFQVGHDYMGTLQEYVMAALMMVIGVNEVSLRLPAALFFGSGVFLTYYTLSQTISREVALASAVLLVPGNAVIVHWQAMPDNAAALFLSAAIAWQTFRVDRSRSLGQWALLGGLAGFGSYIHQILMLQTIGSLTFLAARSTLFKSNTLRDNRVVWSLCASALAASLLLSAVAYHYLTRRETFIAGSLDLAALFIGVFFAGVFVLLAMRALKPSRSDIASMASFVIPLAVLQALPKLWFNYYQLPSLMADQVPLWKAGTYHLKHAHQWFTEQPGLLLNYVLPHLFLGGMAPVSEPDGVQGPFPIDSLGMGSAVGLLVLVALLVRYFWHLKRFLSLPEAVYLLPLILLMLVLFPSWRLFDATSVRYITIFMPGVCLALVLAAKAVTDSKIALTGVVAAFVLYSGYDVLSKRTSERVDQECAALARQLTELKIDGALVSGKCLQDLAWQSEGRFWVGDADYRPGDKGTLYARRSNIKAASLLGTVNVDQIALAQFIDRDAFSYTRISRDVVVYRRKPLEGRGE